MIITSVNNNHIKELLKLKDKKYRDKSDVYLVEGLHLVKEALSEGLIKELILEKPIDLEVSCYISYVDKKVMKKLSFVESSTGIMAVVYKNKEKELNDKLLVLDNIQDPGNLGTMIRSAKAFGIDTIVLSKDTVDLYNDKVVRSTQGMLFHSNIIVRDLSSFLLSIKDEYTIIGTSVTNGKNIKDLENIKKSVIVIGNEGKGISDGIKRLCDEFVYIRMDNDCESLNASVAASILMYEVYNK